MLDAVALTSVPDRDRGEDVTPCFPEWVVPLQPEGKEQPVFVFPSSHSAGAMPLETQMVSHVGGDHPFWGMGRDDAHLDLVRRDGVAALGAEYVNQVRAIQANGPYLLYGNCLGGYLAWETACQLLATGEQIGGILFYEVPLRSDFANVLPGPIPVHSANVWRLSHYYRPPSLPVHLTHLMTAGWHATRWWAPWQQLALEESTNVIIPGETETAFERREERIALHVRNWITACNACISA